MTQHEESTEPGVTLDTLRELWTTAKETHPSLALSARQALKALEREAQAEQIIAHLTPRDSLDALQLCDALQALADTLELWVSVNARLWLECQHEETESSFRALHQSSITHFQQLQMRHYELQDEVVAFCQKHKVLLRLHALPLLITLPLGEMGRKQE